MTDKDDDIGDLADKAKVVAKATGRTEEDVMADLLDDGVVNFSNRKEEKNLVEQLREAAELITTVQSINQDISQNSVLNGGKNSTKVEVETTLEGDLVDRAIESVQRKADNIKKLLVTLTPLLLLITGGSLEAIGVIDLAGDDSPDDVDDYQEEYWGCTAWDAENYDPMATHDDGSCYWEPDCEPMWMWEDDSIYIFDADGQGYKNDLKVEALFHDDMRCNHHMDNGYFEIMIGDDSHTNDAKFHDEFFVNHVFPNLHEGEHFITIAYHTYDGSHWSGPSAWVTSESEPEPEPVFGCTDSEAENYNPQADTDDGSCEYSSSVDDCTISVDNHYRGHADNDPTSTTMIVAFNVVPTDCNDFTIDWSIALFQDGYPPNYTRAGSMSSSGGSVSESFENMPPGTWIPKIRVVVEGDEKWEMNFWSLDIAAPEPEECFDINLYDIVMNTNDTHASVAYDIDCGYSENSLQGQNVSVQFLVFPANDANATHLTYDTKVHLIQGWVQDVHSITLTNFVDENITHYDFFWYAIWIDENGESQFIERTWLNVEIDPTVEVDCSNSDAFNITSLSATFVQNGSNAIDLVWSLEHDGHAGCLDSIRIEINLYQDGNFYGSISFADLGTWFVGSEATTITITAEHASILGNLTIGCEYDALLKFWETNEAGPDADVFTNKVKIS